MDKNKKNLNIVDVKVFDKLAEREGFEPSVPTRSTQDFQSCAFDHSATSPEKVTHIMPKHNLNSKHFLTNTLQKSIMEENNYLKINVLRMLKKISRARS